MQEVKDENSQLIDSVRSSIKERLGTQLYGKVEEQINVLNELYFQSGRMKGKYEEIESVNLDFIGITNRNNMKEVPTYLVKLSIIYNISIERVVKFASTLKVDMNSLTEKDIKKIEKKIAESRLMGHGVKSLNVKSRIKDYKWYS